jgi:hypothetical protein
VPNFRLVGFSTNQEQQVQRVMTFAQTSLANAIAAHSQNPQLFNERFNKHFACGMAGSPDIQPQDQKFLPVVVQTLTNMHAALTDSRAPKFEIVFENLAGGTFAEADSLAPSKDQKEDLARALKISAGDPDAKLKIREQIVKQTPELMARATGPDQPPRIAIGPEFFNLGEDQNSTGQGTQVQTLLHELSHFSASTVDAHRYSKDAAGDRRDGGGDPQTGRHKAIGVFGMADARMRGTYYAVKNADNIGTFAADFVHGYADAAAQTGTADATAADTTSSAAAGTPISAAASAATP